MPDAERLVVVWGLANDIARARGEAEIAAAVARAASLLSGAETVRVWMIDHKRGYRFAGAWPEEAQRPDGVPEEVVRAVVFATPVAGSAEDPFRSHLAMPLHRAGRPLGAVELLERRRPSGPFSPTDAEGLADLLSTADSALAAARAKASREHGRIEAVTRLTWLFDFARSLARAPELDDAVGTVANRLKASLDAEAAYVWIADESGGALNLMGATEDAVAGWVLAEGQGLAGSVMRSGASVNCDGGDEVPGLEDRADVEAGLKIRSAAAAPILSDGKVVGVLEIVNKSGPLPFDVNDLAFLGEAAKTTALALDNTRRLDAERRATDLGALLDASQELGSHLDVQKVAFALAHKAAAVIHYRRASVGLLRGTQVELAAVSGQTSVDETLPEMKPLLDMLRWAAGLDEGLYVVREDDGTIDVDRPETREKFRKYFETTGHRSFLAIPLQDDEGRLGVFALEAAEPYAFSARGLEAAGLLAMQATVAIRNATLYQQIPMVRVFEPLTRRRERFLRLPWARRVEWLAGAALLVAALILIPAPLRVGGDARVLPERRLPVTAEVEGRVSEVFVREGDAVEVGQVLATLDDSDYRAGWEDAQVRHQVALLEQSRFRAGGQAAGAAVEAARLDGLRAELDLWQTRMEGTRIRATVAGLVATPRIEEKAGARLSRGDLFCEVVDPEQHRIEVAVPEVEVGHVRVGLPVKIKLHALPTRSLDATVERVGVAATLVDDERVFLVRARLDPGTLELRSGMSGRAKINTGNAPLGRVLLRRTARWLWRGLWGWLP